MSAARRASRCASATAKARPTRRISGTSGRSSPTQAQAAGWSRSSAQSRASAASRSEEHTSELQSRRDLVCRLLLEKKKKIKGAKNYMKEEHDKRYVDT